MDQRDRWDLLHSPKAFLSEAIFDWSKQKNKSARALNGQTEYLPDACDVRTPCAASVIWIYHWFENCQ